MSLELARLDEPARGAHADLVASGRRGAGGWPDLPGGDLEVLLLERAHHVAGGELARGQPRRVEPQAHRELALAEDAHVAHALARA